MSSKFPAIILGETNTLDKYTYSTNLYCSRDPDNFQPVPFGLKNKRRLFQGSHHLGQ